MLFNFTLHFYSLTRRESLFIISTWHWNLITQKFPSFQSIIHFFSSFIFYPHLLLMPNMSYMEWICPRPFQRNPGFGNVFAKESVSLDSKLLIVTLSLPFGKAWPTTTKNRPSKVTFDSDEPEIGACDVLYRLRKSDNGDRFFGTVYGPVTTCQWEKLNMMKQSWQLIRKGAMRTWMANPRVASNNTYGNV